MPSFDAIFSSASRLAVLFAGSASAFGSCLRSCICTETNVQRTHTHIITLALSRINTHIHIYTLCFLFSSFSLFLSPHHCPSLSFSLRCIRHDTHDTHKHARTHTHTHTHPYALSFSLALSRSVHTYPLTCTATIASSSAPDSTTAAPRITLRLTAHPS